MGHYRGPYYVPDPGETPTSSTRYVGSGRVSSTPPRPQSGGNLVEPSSATGGASGGYYNNGAPTPLPAGTHYGVGGGGSTTGSDIANHWPTPKTEPEQPFTPYSAPGFGEDYYKAHKDLYDKPGAGADYWNGIKGFFANPSYGENQLNNIGDRLFNVPGAAEDRYDRYSASGAYDTPGAAEDFWSKHGDKMMQPGAADEALTGNIHNLGQKGYGENWWEQHQGEFDKSGFLEKEFPYIGGQLRAPSYGEKYADAYRPQDSEAETFLHGGGATGGLDAMYDRLYQQGSKRIGDQGAARGSYNSGASLRGVQELSADLTGRHVQDLQAAVNAADTAKLARERYGMDVMAGGDKGKLGRLDLLGTTADKAQSATLSRLLGGSQASNAAQSSATTRMGALTGASTALGNLVDQRNQTGSQASERAQTAADRRYRTGMDASKIAGDSYMDRLAKAGTAYGGATDRALNRVVQGGQLAGAAGVEDLARVTGGQVAANSAETGKQNRENSVFNNLYKLAEGQAGKYSSMTDQQRSEELQLKLAEIDGQLKKGAISAAEAKQLTDMYNKMLQAPVSAAGVVAGKAKTPTIATSDPDYLLPQSVV